MSNLSDVHLVSLFVLGVNDIDLSSVDLGGLNSGFLEDLEVRLGLGVAGVLSKVNVLLNFMDVLNGGRLLDPVVFLDVSVLGGTVVVVLLDGHVLFAVFLLRSHSVLFSFVSLHATLIVSHSALLSSVLTSISSFLGFGLTIFFGDLSSLSFDLLLSDLLLLFQSSLLDKLGMGSNARSLGSSLGHHGGLDFLSFSVNSSFLGLHTEIKSDSK